MSDIIDTMAVEEKNEEMIFCKYAFPIYSHIIEGDKRVAVITYLCRNDKDKMFTLNRAYEIDNTEEAALDFECLPFAEYDTDDVTRKLQYKWLNNFLPNFTTNLQFYVYDDFAGSEDPVVYTYAVANGTKKKYKIEFKLETFISLLFLDKYPQSDYTSDHDLNLAVINGANVHEDVTKFYIVNSVDIISMVNAAIPDENNTFFEKLKAKLSGKDEDDNTNVAMVLKLEDSNKETLQLLASFDVGVSFDKDKFRGKSISNIEDEYFKDADQYVSTLLLTEAKLYGVDKTYMIIRGVNKDKKSKIFLFDTTMIQNIQDKINGY